MIKWFIGDRFELELFNNNFTFISQTEYDYQALFVSGLKYIGICGFLNSMHNKRIKKYE